MKRRFLAAHDGIDPEHALCAAFAALTTEPEVAAFLRDLCTPAELEALTDRWRVVAPLWQGQPYRDIHACTAVSVTTIGRVARYLAFGHGGYRVAAERLYGPSAAVVSALAFGANPDLDAPTPKRRRGQRKRGAGARTREPGAGRNGRQQR
jgi:TrpR-related protein YerC/YecD